MWIGHVLRIDKQRTVKIKHWRPIAVKQRWEDVRADLGKIKFQIWIKIAMDRKGLKRSVGQVKLTKRCSAKRSRKKI